MKKHLNVKFAGSSAQGVLNRFIDSPPFSLPGDFSQPTIASPVLPRCFLGAPSIGVMAFLAIQGMVSKHVFPLLLNSVGQKNSYHLWHNTWHLVVNWHLVKTQADTWYLAIKGGVSKTIFSCVFIVWADQVVIIIGTTCLLACLRSVGLVLFWVLSVLSAVCLIACDMLD